MEISGFSSIVFDLETYEYDCKGYGAVQQFASTDLIRVCIGANISIGEIIDDVEVIIRNDKGEECQEWFGTTDAFIKSNREDFCVLDVIRLIEDSGNFESIIGCYVITIKYGVKEISARFSILSPFSLKDTFEIRYTNDRNIRNTLFCYYGEDEFDNVSVTTKEQIWYSFRFKGSIVDRDTSFKADVEQFTSQNGVTSLLSGFRKDVYQLCMGDNWGVPNGYGRKLANALSCNMTKINNVTFACADENLVEREEIGDSYPFFRFLSKISMNKEEWVTTANRAILLSNDDRAEVYSNDNEDIILTE